MKHLPTIFVLLLALTYCTTETDRNHMRAGLDSINVRNRNGQPFTVSDVQPYVGFFDEHGTPNDRLLAHYLLGLAYNDHGEAPMALQCYQDADDCADTTDDEIKEKIAEISGIQQPTDVQKLEKKKRNTVLKQLCEYGANIRQVSRITGISYGVIYRAKSGS